MDPTCERDRLAVVRGAKSARAVRSERSLERRFRYEWQRVKLSYGIQLVEGVEVTHEASASPQPVALNLLDLIPSDAENLVRSFSLENGERAFRATQVMQHLWRLPRPGFEEMHELPPISGRACREFQHSPTRSRCAAALDRRNREISLSPGRRRAIETVAIPDGTRLTLCISSQAGCALQCAFCATGAMGFSRNLKPFEIAGQVREVALLDPRESRRTSCSWAWASR